MKRHIFSLRVSIAALIVLVVFGAGTAVLVRTRSGSSGQEPSTRAEQFATGPAGQPGPVTVIVPNYPANPGQPVAKGPFRLLPFGYADPNTPVPQPKCEKPSVNAADPAVVKADSLYADVAYIPDGFQSAPPVATVVCGAEIRELKWSLPGPKAAPLEILRGRAHVPFDVRVPPVDSWYTVEDGFVNGLPAIFLRNKVGQQGPQTIYFFKGDVLTIVDGPVQDFSELVKVAENLR
jgi:hypothetical protein